MSTSAASPRKLLITAGPTHEAIDPVRYLANRSSGKMGFAIAAAAVARGYAVTLVSGPVNLATPTGVERIDVTTAADMFVAVQAALLGTTVAILAAAVADFRPVHQATQKIKKSATSGITLELEKTHDILGSMRVPFGFTGILVGFAAETENLLAHAEAKLRNKGCDMIVANDVSKAGIGFGADANEVVLVFADGKPPIHIPRMDKGAVADAILDCVADL